MREYKETHHSQLYKTNMDMALYSAGCEACQPGQWYGPRVRPYQLIHFVLQGKGTLQINGQSLAVTEGDAFLIPAGQVSYYEASRDDPWTYAWIGFLGIQAQTYMHQIMSSLEDVYVAHGLFPEMYRDAIYEILAFKEDTTSSFLAVNSVLLRIMSFLFSDISFEEQAWGQRSAADEVRFYLDMNYSKNLKMRSVAELLGFHPNYVTRIFQERFGISPKQYLMDLKLKKACSLLTSTQLPVSVVAYSLGFDDPLAFSKFFRREMSMSPSVYRNKMTSSQIQEDK